MLPMGVEEEKFLPLLPVHGFVHDRKPIIAECAH